MTKTSRSKTSHSKTLQRDSLRPWIRDHYAVLRAEAGPRWEHTRAVVVPVIEDTSHKVRDELMPAAAHLSARMAHEAMHRSAPMRAEVADRAAATLAAARGQLSTTPIGQLKPGHKSSKTSRSSRNGNGDRNGHNGHRKLWFVGGAAAAGAALSAAAVLWQRSRYQAWVEDDAVHNALDDTSDPNPERLNSDDPDRDRVNASDADSGTNEHASTSGRHHHRHH